MIALIGAGPLGIEMAVALQLAQLPYTHLEAGPIGSTMAWWAPGTRWFSSNERIAIAGVPLVTPAQEKATREEYLAYLRAVVSQFDLPIQTFRKVTAIRPTPPAPGTAPRFTLTTRHALFPDAPESSLAADHVILATGGTATPNLLNIPGEDLPHVSHYFEAPHRYFGQRLLIVGGRNSAVEAALRCHRAGAKVTLIHHAAAIDTKDIKYWLYPEFASLIKTGAITAHFNTTLQQITQDRVTLQTNNAADAMRQSPHDAASHPHSEFSLLHSAFDFILLLTGYRADMSLAQMAGVTLSPDQQIPTFDPATMQSNIPGIYIVGTAIAGSQRRYKVFLENCHIHVPRVLAHLTGQAPPVPEVRPETLERPES